MQEKYLIRANSNTMLSLFSNLDMPFRCQENVCITIPYTEYCDFVKLINQVPVRWLSFDKTVYTKGLQGNGEYLHKLYLFDVSKIILNELCIAMTRGKDATMIFHEFDNTSDSISYTDISKYLSSTYSKDILRKAKVSVERCLIAPLNLSNMSEHNHQLYRMAWLLRAMCYVNESRWFDIKIND